MDKKQLWDKYDELKEDCFKNHELMEAMVNEQLKIHGVDFFIENDIHIELARFESTLPQFCEAYEKSGYKESTLALLFFSYVRLGDMENARRIKELLNVIWADGIEDFQPDENIVKGNIIEAKYDRRIGELANYLLEGIEKVEEFLVREFKGNVPKKILVNLINHDGPSPFNSLLYEMFIKSKGYGKNEYSRNAFQSTIVHETTHFVSDNYLLRNKKLSHSRDTSCHKFIDEGFAEWNENIFLHKEEIHRVYVDNSAFHGLSSGFIELGDLKNRWYERFNQRKFMIYNAAASFIYFLEETFGYYKVNGIFAECEKYQDVTSFEDYFNLYFNRDFDGLMKQWLDNLVESYGSRKSVEGSAIESLRLESKTDNILILTHDTKHFVRPNDNIWIYDDKMKLCKAQNMKDRKIQVDIPSQCRRLTAVAFWGKYKQSLDIELC